MFGQLRTKFNLVGIKVIPDGIVVDGVNTTHLLNDITTVFNTTVVSKYMFEDVRRFKFKVKHFFAPDLVFVLRTVRDSRGTRTSKRTLTKIIDLILNDTWVGDIDSDNIKSIVDESKLKNLIPFTYMDYQLDFIRHYGKVVPSMRLRGYMLDAGPGTGKTLTGLSLGNALGAKKIVCVVPLPAVESPWRVTIEETLLTSPKCWLSTRDGALNHDYRYYVVHYQRLGDLLEHMKTYPREWEDTFINIDESHNFNEINSQRSEILVKICNLPQVKNVLWASGTPIKAMGSECIPFFRTVDPYFDASIEKNFRKLYGRGVAIGAKDDRNRISEIIRNRLGHMKYHVPAQDVVDVEVKDPVVIKVKVPNAEKFTLESASEAMSAYIDLRRKYYETNRKKYEQYYWDGIRYFEDTLRGNEREQFNKYQSYIKTISAGFDPSTMSELSKFCNRYEQRTIIPRLPSDMKQNFRSGKSVVKYVDLKIMGEALGSVLGKLRSECNRAIVENLDLASIIDGLEKKALVFTSYVDVIKTTEKKLIDEGYTPVVVYGETSKQLPRLVKEFHINEELNPLVATLQTLSTAVPITVANGVIFLNQPFRDNIRQQAIARAARKGQDTAVHIFDILLDTGDKPNLSTRNQDIVEWSRQQVAKIVHTDNIDLDTLSFEMYQPMLDGGVSLDDMPEDIMESTKFLR